MQQSQNMQSEALRIFLLPGCTIRMLTTEHTSQSTRGKLKKKSPTMQQYRKLLLQQKKQLDCSYRSYGIIIVLNIYHQSFMFSCLQIKYITRFQASVMWEILISLLQTIQTFFIIYKVQSNQMSSLESHRREKWTCEEGLSSFSLILQQVGMHTDRICSQSNNCMLMNFQVMKL